MKQEEINEIRSKIIKDMERKIKQLEQAIGLSERIERLLPSGWEIFYLWIGELSISKRVDDDKYVDAEEYRQVCKHLERITNIKLNRRVCGDALLATHAGWYDGNIDIRVECNRPTCKIEYKEVVKPETKETIAVVAPECLGL